MASGPLITTINDISIHALREEGDHDGVVYKVALICISIHALREEGDHSTAAAPGCPGYFYPRPPRGGRPDIHCNSRNTQKFLSTPSARRATQGAVDIAQATPISIHALREEGDVKAPHSFGFINDFYPRPPRGGRRVTLGVTLGVTRNFYPRPPRGGRRMICST